MPRLLGAAALAHHAGKKGAQKQAAADQQAQAAQQAPAPVAEVAPAPVATSAAAPVDPQMAQLENLANLHTQGILSDAEFAAAKAKALGI